MNNSRKLRKAKRSFENLKWRFRHGHPSGRSLDAVAYTAYWRYMAAMGYSRPKFGGAVPHV